ncbi:hypothetical protein [Microbacterium sp. NPDC055599]
MSVLIEKATGAQALPDMQDARLKFVNGWTAHLACDADLRRRSPEYTALAQMLIASAKQEGTDDV